MQPFAHDISPLVWGCIAVQAGWLLWALRNFARRNDDLPLITAGFLAYCGGYRFLGRYFGFGEWVDLGALSVGTVTFGQAGMALALITFGQTVLLLAYGICQNKTLAIREERVSAILLSRLRRLLLFLTAAGLPAILWSRHYISQEISAGKSLAFEVSNYAQLFPMMSIGLLIFLFLAWRFGALRGFYEKSAALILLLVVGYLTFGPYGRFMFLGWIIGGCYIVSSVRHGGRRIPFLIIGASAALILFGVAGAMRNEHEDITVIAGIKRAQMAEDANMLDGLVLLMEVYPQRIPFQYGRGHLEILERPIPRAWWPNKPVGGYMNKLRIFDAESAGTISISPTLFGSFYEEGGWWAVFMLSVIYGWALAWIVRCSWKMRPLFAVLIRACLLAGMIPLLRGDDLPGIYAWLGMAFWPMLLFLWWNREYLRSEAGNAAGETNRRKEGREKRALQADSQPAPCFDVWPARSEIPKTDLPARDWGAVKS
jgi:hypothetical protein